MVVNIVMALSHPEEAPATIVSGDRALEDIGPLWTALIAPVVKALSHHEQKYLPPHW